MLTKARQALIFEVVGMRCQKSALSEMTLSEHPLIDKSCNGLDVSNSFQEHIGGRTEEKLLGFPN